MYVFNFCLFYRYRRLKHTELTYLIYKENVTTVKPTHVVTSIKQSHVFKYHIFHALLWKISYELYLF